YVGRISPEKGVHILLDAFQKMVHDYPELELEIIGPQWVAPIEFIVALSNDPKVSDLAPFHGGGYLSYLRERLPPDFVDRVAFSGSLPHADLKDHYLESDVFVQPSFSDAFPFTVVEAMASGLPVVASRVGGIPEAVAEGKTGLLVEPADTPGLAGAVVRLVMDQDLRETMGKAARQRAIEVFSWERIVDSLLCQYSNICEALR
ncbi:MAG: glycosyltransferase family 4 protein, partial [Acidiferrobacterales bacterium]